jgi:hypothetical protein
LTKESNCGISVSLVTTIKEIMRQNLKNIPRITLHYLFYVILFLGLAYSQTACIDGLFDKSITGYTISSIGFDYNSCCSASPFKSNKGARCCIKKICCKIKKAIPPTIHSTDSFPQILANSLKENKNIFFSQVIIPERQIVFPHSGKIYIQKQAFLC